VLRLVAGHAPRAPKTPFVLLVLALLGGGLITLLLLNSAAAADAFAQRELQQKNRALSVQEQELVRQVAALEAPGSLDARARRLGLVPAGAPGFLVVDPSGRTKVTGSPAAAASPAPPPKPTPSRPPTPAAGTRATPTTTMAPGAAGRPSAPSGARAAIRRSSTPAPGGDR
jgi:cell division protein FtsB